MADALKEAPRQPDLLALQRKLEQEQRSAQLRASHAGLVEARPISLDFREASLRTVLDVVSRNSGINFILDKDIKPDVHVTVFLRNAKVEEAIDLIVDTYLHNADLHVARSLEHTRQRWTPKHRL